MYIAANIQMHFRHNYIKQCSNSCTYWFVASSTAFISFVYCK